MLGLNESVMPSEIENSQFHVINLHEKIKSAVSVLRQPIAYVGSLDFKILGLFLLS